MRLLNQQGHKASVMRSAEGGGSMRPGHPPDVRREGSPGGGAEPQ